MDAKLPNCVIVCPSLVYSGRLDVSRPMSEGFNHVYMYLFDNHDHGKLSYVGESAPTFLMIMIVLWMNY